MQKKDRIRRVEAYTDMKVIKKVTSIRRVQEGEGYKEKVAKIGKSGRAEG